MYLASFENWYYLQLWFVLSSTVLATGIASDSAVAQVTADESLTTQVNTSDNLNFVIEKGVQAGGNLFHSFQEFSIPTSGSVEFANSPEIQNIINRVTGLSPSNLDGLLTATGSANVFLLNPNGIIFGPNASLNLGGSFVASTAESLIFEDGSQFSTNPNQTKPLLTISVPIGLQFGANSGNILHQSSTLQLESNQTIALVGSGMEFDGGQIIIPSGQIELGSVGENSFVSLNPDGWQLGYEQVEQFQDLQLTNLAKVDASGLGGGGIHVQGRNISLTGGSKLLSNTLGSFPGENILVNASESLQVIGTTDLPNLFEPLELASGIFIPLRSSISTTTAGNGDAGDIKIDTTRLLVKNGGQITANAFLPGTGNGGEILINAVESAEISGNAIIPKQQGKSPFSAPGLSDQFFVEINSASSIGTVSGGIGKSGNLTINTGKLTVRDGGVITASPFGEGKGAEIKVNANEVLLSGTSASEVFFSGIFSGAIGNGDSGNLIISTDVLKILNGARLSASTFGKGQGGELIVNAVDGMEIAGTSKTGTYSSSVVTQSSGSGDAGNITLNTGKLSISDQARLAVDGLDVGSAGNLSIIADSLSLGDRGKITATTNSGNGGNLNLQIDNILLMEQNSLVSAEAMNNANGGNINLNAGFIVALPQANNDIIASASLGNGGNIEIFTQGIFGLQQREQNSITNDLDASSQFSLDGTVTIATPEIEPDRGLLNLSVELINVDQILRRSFCRISSDSKYINTGRGGIPVAPTDNILAESTWEDWRIVQPEPERSSNSPPKTTSVPATPRREIVPVQGWVVNSEGKVVLTAQPLAVNPHPPQFHPSGCN